MNVAEATRVLEAFAWPAGIKEDPVLQSRVKSARLQKNISTELIYLGEERLDSSLVERFGEIGDVEAGLPGDVNIQFSSVDSLLVLGLRGKHARLLHKFNHRKSLISDSLDLALANLTTLEGIKYEI